MTATVPRRASPVATVKKSSNVGGSYVISEQFLQSQAIKVYVRLKPPEDGGDDVKKSKTEKKKTWTTQKSGAVESLSLKGARKTEGKTVFNFDQVFDEDAQTPLLYKSIARSMVHTVIAGKHATIFAYGQTGSGKTFTMQGDGKVASGQAGLMQLVVSDLFRFIRTGAQLSRDFSVKISYIEVYNERVRDLLSEDYDDNVSHGTPVGATPVMHNSGPEVQIRSSENGEVSMNCISKDVKSVDEAMNLFVTGNGNRVVSKKDSSRHSSRSHAIFRITVESSESDLGPGAEVLRVADFNLVDLAGSEAGTWGKRSKDAPKVNQGLLSLWNVVDALSQSKKKRPTINFRESKLTTILQPHLQGNAEVSIICSAIANKDSISETKATLKFGAKARLIPVNPKVNELKDDSALIKKLQNQLAEAKRQLETYRREGVPEDDRDLTFQELAHVSTESFDDAGLQDEEQSYGYDDMDAGPGHREYDFVSNQEAPPPPGLEEEERLPTGMGGRQYVMPKNTEIPPELERDYAMTEDSDDEIGGAPKRGSGAPMIDPNQEIPLNLGEEFPDHDTSARLHRTFDLRSGDNDMNQFLKGRVGEALTDDELEDSILHDSMAFRLDAVDLDPGQAEKNINRYLKGRTMTDSSTDGSMDLYSDDEEELSALERVSTDLPLPGGKGSRQTRTTAMEMFEPDGPEGSYAAVSMRFGSVKSRPDTLRGDSTAAGRSVAETLASIINDRIRGETENRVSWDTMDFNAMQPDQIGKPLKAVHGIYQREGRIPQEITVMDTALPEKTDQLCLTDRLYQAEARAAFMNEKLEKSDDLVEGVFKDLERARLCIHDLVYRNTQLSKKLKSKQREDVKEEYQEGEVVIEQYWLLKGSIGRASPAQMAGVIQRGDILLAIGRSSLVNLPIDQLMSGLAPLSSPECPDGPYKRILRVRLEAGTGHELLKSHEAGLKRPRPTGSSAMGDDMFALFPMVDQLSGQPLFDPALASAMQPPTEEKEPDPSKPTNEKAETVDEIQIIPSVSADDETAVVAEPDDLISSFLLKEKVLDRKRFASAYFNWNEDFSDLLKEKQRSIDLVPEATILSNSERLDLGRKVMELTKNLTYSMEDIDKGKDLRSFKMWSSNFSLRSGASARRRYMMDAASIRSHRSQSAENSVDGSIESTASGSLGSVDGDALLLGLAAHDDIWRRQVIEALENEIEKMEGGVDEVDSVENDCNSDTKPGIAAGRNISDALSNELGAFLFGENMNKIITNKKKSHALPPEDITTVLFDLATHIATTAPDEVTLFGGTTNSYSYTSSTGTEGKTKARVRADIILANNFLLQEALPVWMKSFRQLGLEQRRLIWPKARHGSTGSYTGTNTLSSDVDSLTIDSSGTSPKPGSPPRNLQETIEDLELDVETRAETCFLVTYYFTQHILSQYGPNLSSIEKEQIDHELIEFVQSFGTYLQIHSCLSFASKVETEIGVRELLLVAEHDPSHREAVKEIHKANDLTFYDASKISAVLKFLLDIRREKSEQRRKVIRNLCVAAFPDIQPWQVKKACTQVPGKKIGELDQTELSGFYYSYLSRLLDPVEGVEVARRDSSIVKEWCTWSIGISKDMISERGQIRDLQNFFKVASRTSSDHLAYRRDVVTLLEYSMEIHEYHLALDLVSEIIESRKLAKKEQTIERVLVCLRQIAVKGVTEAWNSSHHVHSFHTLKRILKAFHQMSTSELKTCRESVSVPDELVTILTEWRKHVEQENNITEMLLLIDFLINEASPHDVLSALVSWSEKQELRPALYSRLDTLLRRGVKVSMKSELSSFLLRLKQLRNGYSVENKALMPSKAKAGTTTGGIWKQMSIGALSIEK